MDLDPNIFPRAFDESDAEAVSCLIIEDLVRVNARDYGEEAARLLASFYTPELIREYARHGEMFVAEVGDGKRELVGTVTLEGGRVRNLFVRVDVHGQGVGRRLMGFVENLARRSHLARLGLTAGLSAAEFYERLGYERVGEVDEQVGSASIRLIVMEKML